jgi:hypothetical protein
VRAVAAVIMSAIIMLVVIMPAIVMPAIVRSSLCLALVEVPSIVVYTAALAVVALLSLSELLL